MSKLLNLDGLRRRRGRWGWWPSRRRWLVQVLLLLALQLVANDAQQTYVNNRQLACYDTTFDNITRGYQCNSSSPSRSSSSCQSYLTFRSADPYNSAAVIGYLLGAEQSAPLIASINNISSDTSSIPTDTQVIVPVNCSCTAGGGGSGGQFYQHNASYTLKTKQETYFTVANNTYQGLTTCQALMFQNPYDYANLTVGLRLVVPLRCACPSSNQTAMGFKYLLTYMVTWGDSISSIAQLFGADEQAVLDANRLSADAIIYPFTPILVPLTTEPTAIKIQPSAASPPPQSAPIIPVGDGSGSGGSKKKKWVIYVGVAIGIALFLFFIAAMLTLFWYRKSRNAKPAVSTPTASKMPGSTGYEASSDMNTKSWSLSSYGVRNAVESLTMYKFEDLQIATDYFSQANKIKGVVYKGSFKGDAAAVKIMKGDVSVAEINILKMINHSNIIRLSGFCLHDGNTYLVYEYAENGCLSDCLRSHLAKGDRGAAAAAAFCLNWKQRVQIAYDVADALNYLHNYTNPPYIHKNLKSSNILLDANLRAKIANFALARALEEQGSDGGLQMTRHVVGTQGYMPPEYVENGVITPKFDVFAFGVVMLELLSGQEAVVADNKNAGEDLLYRSISPVLEGDNVREKLRGFMDPNLSDEYPLDLAYSLAQLAKTCVASDLNARPSIPQVFMTISKILSSSLDWDPSDELDRSTSVTRG